MAGRLIQVKLLNGQTFAGPITLTYNELLQKVAKKEDQDPRSLDLYCNGVFVDLEKFGNIKIEDTYDKSVNIDTMSIIIYVGRKKYSIEHDPKAIDKELVDSEMSKCTAPTPVLRGYTGHVPGRKYAYGLASSQSNKQQMLPPEIAEKEQNGFKLTPDIALGYKGFIRGQQHVAARTFTNLLHETMDKDFATLAQGSILPTEPQNIGQGRAPTLDDNRIRPMIL
eukprot:TRINITY_DN65720_c0_g2_i1.p1 TRINITY_DN65720_c0_g2~~TRINITY_DN65720_c0_g2_i1.p1  ORF type:complete len:224 (-),score=0.04 TRINITY_DN65720_c0_g2_i1:67-738(-)